MGVLPAHMSVHYMYAWCQRRPHLSWNWSWQVAVSWHVGAGIKPGPLEEHPVFLTHEPFLQPQVFVLFYFYNVE